MPLASFSTENAPVELTPALRPVKLRTSTPAEQIARHLGQAILQGQYGPGQRIGEQAIADMFSVSRGPVRDALQALAKQGLVDVQPRRGTFVVDLDVNDVVDIFNIRGMMMALAARYLAARPEPERLDELATRLEELRQLAAQAEPPLVEFVKAVGRMGTGVVKACGNRQLIQTYRNLPHDSVWQMLWVNQAPLDYRRVSRRHEALQDYEKLLVLLRAGAADAAEAMMRKIVGDSCREVAAHMRETHADAIDDFRLNAL